MRLTNAFRNASIAVKIAIFALLTTLIFIVSLVSLIAPNILGAIASYGQEQALSEVKIVQSQFTLLEKQLTSATSFLSFASGVRSALENGDLGALRASAILFQDDALTLDFVHVVRLDGGVVVNLQKFVNRVDRDGLKLLADEAFEQGTTSGLVGSTVDGEAAAPVLVTVSSVKDSSGTLLGAVLVGRRVDTAFMDQLRLEREETHVGLLYQGGLVAQTTGAPNEIDRLDEAADLIAQAQEGEIPVKVSLGGLINNTPDIQAYAPAIVGGSTVGVFALRIEYSVLFSLQAKLMENIRIAVVIVALIVSNVLVVLIQQGIIRPVRNLIGQIERITSGDYSERLAVLSTDEIGRMSASFNRMSDVVQQREADLKTLNQTLEQRVRERTREMREARDDAVAAQRLAQENSRLKSEFLATMSHELRTPLNAIEGFSGIMLSGMGVELSPIAEDMMKRVSANSKRLLHLINDFLDLSRIESGRLDFVKEPLNIRRLAKRWRESVSVLAEEKRLDFKVVIDENVPETVMNDEDALTKIVINLLSNAFKFTRQGSVELRLEMRESRFIIKVTDTGIGIPIHARDYIFEEFRQVDGSSKREYGGTGLGLALVSKLTRLLNGSVLLESEVGKGSVFTVELALEAEEILA